ncbi:hypothetical protein F5148DRAFT_444371 [Russula earlei]|uniref:Uncharacterized protein n=1 Tax=Russula earlei TaxID=71964 RepID=A0ACC0TZV4_9AGAM|nr:hypothetical protein F5148DRAFT_444371 [Russula earlei]
MRINFVDRSSPAYYIWSLLPTGDILRATQSQSLTVLQFPARLPNSLIGIRVERRRYFSNLRLRDELMRLYHVRSVLHQQNTLFVRLTMLSLLRRPFRFASLRIHEKRQRTKAKITSSIRRHFGPAYHVEAFGSTEYGVDGPTSDLDLIVIDPERMAGFTPDVDLSSLPRVYKIREVSNVLQRSGFKILARVSAASVPIVKFKDPDTGIQCDLNINDQLGSINTSLVRHYCDILPVLRPLLLAIKRWARPLGYNSPTGALGTPVTFSSYTLSIMTIGLLQTRGLLPNLQKGDDLPEGKIFWIRTKTQERIRCDARWKKFEHWRPPGTVEVEQALQDWFQYWGHEHEYRNNLLNIRWGGVVPREVPCKLEELESLRDGPFSGFRPPPDKRLQKSADGKAGSNRNRSRKKAASEVEVEVLDGQLAQGKQAAEAVSNRIDGTPLIAAARDEEEQAFNETGSEAKRAFGDRLGFAAQETDNAQPPQWHAEMLCVADPFIRSKNLAGSIRPHVVAHFREDCQRVVMRLRIGGNLDSLLWFDPRTRPLSPPPQPRRKRRQQQPVQGAHNSAARDSNRNQPIATQEAT